MGGEQKLDKRGTGIIHVDAASLLVFPASLDHSSTEGLSLLVKVGGSSAAKAIGKIVRR